MELSVIIGVCAFIIILIVVIVLILTNKENFKSIEDHLASPVDSITSKLSSQPLVFLKNYKVAPGNCKPYSGCFFPSTLSNPVDLNTGERTPVKDGIYCEKSWRDCNAYQECVSGKCISKI